MSSFIQKLKMKRSDYPKTVEIKEYGTRTNEFTGLGREIENPHKKLRDVVCVEACRTPYGKARGKLKEYDAPQLGALAIQECMRRVENKVNSSEIDYIIMGQVVPAGCGQIPSRQASILAGIPLSVPSITINKVCSSGLKSIDLGFQMIQTGRAEIVIAGGQESMSNAPYSVPDLRNGKAMGLPNLNLVDLMVYDGLWDAFYNRHMAIHGTEVADEFGISREDQDDWALLSQSRATNAMSENKLSDEIFPVEINNAKEILYTDEGPNANLTIEKLRQLNPIFNHKSPVSDNEGCVTAGNAPGVNDGSNVVMIMSKEKADFLGMKPLFSIIDYAEVSQNTKDIATVPGLAIQKILKQNNLTIEDIDLIEINEAFAAVVLVSAQKILGMTKNDMRKKVNVNGSAIAFGHPIGASGARILMTLAYELRRRGGGLGVCGICSGHAQGDSILIKVEP